MYVLPFVLTAGRRRSSEGQAKKKTKTAGNSPHSLNVQTCAFEYVNLCNCINLNFISQVVLIHLMMTMQILQKPVREKQLKKVEVSVTPSICNCIPSVCASDAFVNVINFDYVISFCRCC